MYLGPYFFPTLLLFGSLYPPARPMYLFVKILLCIVEYPSLSSFGEFAPRMASVCFSRCLKAALDFSVDPAVSARPKAHKKRESSQTGHMPDFGA